MHARRVGHTLYAAELRALFRQCGESFDNVNGKEIRILQISLAFTYRQYGNLALGSLVQSFDSVIPQGELSPACKEPWGL
jgi:hypothetical protein